MYRTQVSVETLEARNGPSDLLGSIPLWAAAAATPAPTLAPAEFRPVNLPRYDLACIGSSNDGRPSRYLDLAHEALKKPKDVGSVGALAAEINTTANKLNRPVDVVVVGCDTSGSSGVVLGKSYLFADSESARELIREAKGNVRSMLWLVDNAQLKGKLYQQLADGLAGPDAVTIQGYGRAMRVMGSPAEFYTAGELMTWRST